MKSNRFTLVVAAMMALFLWSCKSDNVAPKAEGQNGMPTLAADNTVHPGVYPICSEEIIYDLMDSQGNLQVQYCGFFPCNGSEPNWGTAKVFNDTASLYMNIDLAFGWYIKLSESFVGFESDMSWTNGIPQPETNWIQYSVNPLVTSYQVQIPLDLTQPNCFDLAAKIVAVKLDFFSGEDVNSVTDLWIRNTRWNSPDYPEENTSSPFVSKWCFQPCGPQLTEITDGSCSGCNSENTVIFYDCDSVDVSSCKDLSNVVLAYTDGTWEKYDGLSSKTGSFDGTGANASKEISHVYVKSGCFKSGEGPGFGRRFDGPCFDSSLINIGGGGNGGGGNGNGGGKGKNK